MRRLDLIIWTVLLGACGAEGDQTAVDEPLYVDPEGQLVVDEPVDPGKADVAGVTGPRVGLVSNGKTSNGKTSNGADFALAKVDLRTVRMPSTPPAAGANPDPAAPSVAVRTVELEKGVMVERPLSLRDRAPKRRGRDFQGALVNGVMTDGQAVPLFIERITNSADPELPRYVVKAYYGDRWSNPQPGDACSEFGICPKKWGYVCGVRPVMSVTERRPRFEPVPVVAIPGQWSFERGFAGAGGKVIDSTNTRYRRDVTFACETGAIGKCALLGYKPWSTGASGQSLELPHEACVRMIRADYCGDGQEHTMDGILIDVWDNAGMQQQLPYSVDPAAVAANPATGAPFGLEAEWTPNGARCISQVLMPRTSHDEVRGPNGSAGLTVQRYLEDPSLNPHCARKWPAQTPHPWVQPPQQDSYLWSQDGCFGWNYLRQDQSGVVTDFAGQGPAANPRDRTYLRNSSVCVDDGGMPYHQPNPMKTSAEWRPRCLPGT